MSKVIFSFEQILTEIQCNENDLMENICLKYAYKIKKDLKSLYFLYSGNIINLKLQFKNVINNSDKKNKYMTVLVYKAGTIIPNKDKIVKSKQIICPKCSGNALIIFDNYKIKLICKKCGENTILISEYENTQKLDQYKIICEICKHHNKAETFQNQFSICLECKINICPLCKNTHNPNHNMIDYDYKTFICQEHYEKYEFFCKICKKNLCSGCIKFHSQHETIIFGNIMPDKDELNKSLEKFKEIKDYFIIDIKETIKKLEKVMENLEILYKQNEEMINNYLDLKQNNKISNYEMIMNFNYLNSEDNDLIKDMEEIIDDDGDDDENKINEVINMLNIYYKMESRETENENNSCFENLKEGSEILLRICSFALDDFDRYIKSDEIIPIFRPFKKIGKNSLLSLISKKFTIHNLPRLIYEFDKHLDEIDLYDEYKKEIINKFSCDTEKIFDSNCNENLITNFITRVYGKSHLACFIYFTSKEGEEITENKDLFFLNGKLELTNQKFDFNKTVVFLYGNFGRCEDDDYVFDSYQNQNANIFAKFKDGLIYVVFYRDFGFTQIEKVLKIQNNFMKDKIIYIIDDKFEMLLKESFEENKSFEKVDELFENYDNSAKYEAELKELIIYQIKN